MSNRGFVDRSNPFVDTPADRADRHRARFWQALALAAGASLWCPGLGFHVGGYTLQPAELLGIALAVLLLPVAVDVALWRLSAAGLAYFSWVWTALIGPDGTRTVTVLGYYALALGPLLVFVSLAITDPRLTRSLLRGFLVGGSITVALAAYQGVAGSSALDLRSNDNFALPDQARRVFALFPEASSLAAALQILIGVLVANGLAGNPLRLGVFSRRGLVIGACIALAMTRSTSALFVLPLLVTTAVAFSPLPMRRRLRILAVSAATLLLGLGLFVASFYGVRLDNASGLRSGVARSSTIVAALETSLDRPWRGLGLGENQQVSDMAAERLGGGAFGDIRVSAGINSLTVSRIYEEGPLVIAATVAALWSLAALLLRRPASTDFVLLITLIGSCLVSTFVSGYRGLPISWLWYLSPVMLLYVRHVADDAIVRPEVVNTD